MYASLPAWQHRKGGAVELFDAEASALAVCLPSRWRLRIWRRRVLHAETQLLTRFLTLPVDGNILSQRMGHADGPGSGAFFDTGSTEPAFLGVEDYGWSLLFRVGHHNVGRTYLYAKVAAVTYGGIKFLPLIRCGRIGCHVYFITHERLPPGLGF